MINQNNKTLNSLIVYGFMAVASLLLLNPVLLGEVSFCITPDNRHQAYPFFNKLTSSLWKGYLPVWDANTYGGKNFAGEFQSGIFYPVSIIWSFLFGSAKGIDVYYVDLLMAVHFFICLIGMYSLGRVLKLNQLAAVVAALVFTFAGTPAIRANSQTCIFMGLCLLPWTIYFLSKYYMTERRKKYLVFAGLMGGLQILAGHIQPFFHAMLIAFIMIIYFEYAAYQNRKDFIRAVVINSAILGFVAILLALPQMYYALQYMTDSYRWVDADSPVKFGEKVPLSTYAHKHMLKPLNVLNYFNKIYEEPDDANHLWMGVLPFFIFIVFLVKSKAVKLTQEQVYLKRFLFTVLIVGLLSSIGYLTFFHLFLYYIPFVNTIRELGRYVILINFSAALMVGLAITHITSIRKALVENTSSKWIFYVLVALSINALYLVLFQRYELPRFVSIPFFLAFTFFVLLWKLDKPMLTTSLIVAFVFVELFMNKVHAVSTKDNPLYPTTYYKRNSIINFLEGTYGKYRTSLEVKNDELLRRNLGNVFNIQTRFGYCATVNRRYYDFVSQSWDPHSDVYDFLNIRYVVSDSALDSGFVFRDSAQNLYLYERKNYYPRAYWKSQINKPGPVIEEENKATIKQMTYTDLYQKYEVDCLSADTLIFAENMYPGWKCYVDNKRVEIFPAPIKDKLPLFRSVALEKGHHVIEFKYNKPFFLF